MIRACIGLALFASSTLAAPVTDAVAQQSDSLPERFAVMTGVGIGILPAVGAFARAYDGGRNLRLGARAAVGRGWWLTGSLDVQVLPYDRRRFFERRGVTRVDLHGQFHDAAHTLAVAAGARRLLVRGAGLDWYAAADVGYVRRRATRHLVSLYCSRPSVVIENEVLSIPTDWTPAPTCADERAETRVHGDGITVGVWTGTEWRASRRCSIVAEIGYALVTVAPIAHTIPLRMGWAFRF